MQELKGKYVNVVLTVQEGKGMDFLKSNVYIVANFNGRVMESDPCEPKATPSFCTELVWESEKKDLRKVRSVNSPLRVECCTMDENLKKETIGFVLLSLRSAPIIPPSHPDPEVPFKWYKLLGVPSEFRHKHPELYLSLTIRDHMCSNDLPPAIPYPAEMTASNSGMLDTDVIPIRFLQDGYIQIGDDNVAKSSFKLTISVNTVYNLHLLLPENLVFRKPMNKYYLTFAIFGLSLKSKPFYKDLHEPVQLDEKVFIKLSSSYSILKTFFEQYYDAVICFYNGTDKLGVTNVKMKRLVQKEDFMETSDFEENCYFASTTQEEPEDYEEIEERAYVNIDCKLELEPADEEDAKKAERLERKSSAQWSRGKDKNKFSPLDTPKKIENQSPTNDNVQPEKLDANTKNCVDVKKRPIEAESGSAQIQEDEGEYKDAPGEGKETEECPTHTIGYGDQKGDCKVEQLLTNLGKTDNKVKSLAALDKQEEPDNMISKSVPTLKIVTPREVKSPVADAAEKEETDDDESAEYSLENYKQFSFFIIVESVIWKKKTQCKDIIVQFHHPKSNVTAKIVTDVPNLALHQKHMLENIHCKLFFITQESTIRDLIQTHLPKIIIKDSGGKRLFEDITIDAKGFLDSEATENTSYCDLISSPKGENCGELTVAMFLEEINLEVTKKSSNTDLLPPILDDTIVTNSLENLQKWKEDQMSDYLTHLKLLEKIHIAKLSKDWNKRKMELEEKLINSVEKCKKLSRELQKTKASLKVDKALEVKRKALHDHLEVNFNEDLYKNMVKYSHCDNIDLLTKITEIRLENEQLRQVIKDQKFEMEKHKMHSLTNEQTTNLLQELKTLQEKYEEVQKAKSYFKDEWKKAIKEIHDLKTDCQKHLQNQIQNNKEELNQLKMDRVFDTMKFVDTQWAVTGYGDFNFSLNSGQNKPGL